MTGTALMRLSHFAAFILLSILTAYGQEDSIRQAIFDNFFSKNGKNQPDFTTRLYPVKATKDTVNCILSVFLPEEDSLSPVRIMLQCDRLPDKVPPVIVADGQVLEKLSQGSTFRMKNGVESHEYHYQYKFFPAYGGFFTCQATDLAFNGTAYTGTLDFRADAAKGNPDGHPAGAKDKDISKSTILLLLIGCYALSYQLFKVRFRKETGADFAAFILQHHRLPLSADWATTHYGLSQMMFCLAVVFIILYAWEYAANGKNPVFLLVPALIMLPIGMASWRLQKRKLYFKEIKTALSKEEIFEAVGEIGEKDEWSLEYAGEDCIVAHTSPGMWSLTWGEQIFIVFDEKRIWVNSINDLNKRTNIISFIRNKRNIRKVEEAVRNKEKTIRNI